MDLIKEGISILEERKLRFVARFIPYFLSSYGAHNFNLINRMVKAYTSFGRVPDTRLQILFTAPPGWSKSMFLKQLLNETYGLVNNGQVPVRFAGSVTEAAWTGSASSQGGVMVPEPGLAEKYKTGIVGMEEFKAITIMMESTHSSHLEQALAMSLFEGDVEKDLKGAPIAYHTDVTIWAGNQIMNFSLSGGLFRRFFQVFWTPRLSEAQEMEDAVWDGDNVPFNHTRLVNYRMELDRMTTRLKGVTKVQYSDDFRKSLHGVPHFEKSLYKCFALGYTVMSDTNLGPHLIIECPRELNELINTAIIWRKQLLADPKGYQVESLLYDLGAADEDVAWADVRDKNLLFSVSFEETDQILKTLLLSGRVKYTTSGRKLRLA